jgi:hypothetical protein
MPGMQVRLTQSLHLSMCVLLSVVGFECTETYGLCTVCTGLLVLQLCEIKRCCE